MENLERALTRKIHNHRIQAEYFRRRAVDLMTWKQFNEFNPSGVFKGKSKKIISLLEFSKSERESAIASRKRLDTLLDLAVMDGGRPYYFPSNPIGQLREVSNA